jgi:hypothetical protein
MAEANEALVRAYFELRGYFVRTNVLYQFRKGQGMGWSDIDLCAINPRSGDAAAVEVKGWHTESITPSYIKEWPNLFYFVRPEALAAAEELLGRSDFRRILVVGRIGERGRERVLSYARERGVEMMEFPTILAELIDKTPVNRSAGTDAEHAIRVLKAYGLLKSD